MITKFHKHEKLYESLPRQSTVDQLKRIRDEIKKSQTIKVGPDESTMKGDVGDRVIGDLTKRKGMNNMFWWDNPLDRHIDSYETFVKDDSRQSLGYTEKGDPKSHKGTDYVKESSQNVDIDPLGEEIWDDGDDDITKKIKDKILEFINVIGGEYMQRNRDRVIERFFPNLQLDIGGERFYEIRGNFGDHMLDQGDRLGVVRARSHSEAKSIFILVNDRRDYIDILLTGFYRTNIINQEQLNRSLEENRRKLRNIQSLVNDLENPKGIDDI